MKRKGLVQVYTGDGKGKSTAAIGQAVRAAGHGLKVGVVCFFKDPEGNVLELMQGWQDQPDPPQMD